MQNLRVRNIVAREAPRLPHTAQWAGLNAQNITTILRSREHEFCKIHANFATVVPRKAPTRQYRIWAHPGNLTTNPVISVADEPFHRGVNWVYYDRFGSSQQDQ